MKITYLGHAGLFIETQFGSILCDPWYTPAYFSSWFPFPDNEMLMRTKVGCKPTYLYISHLHQDHFDQTYLKQYVWSGATVLLPDYPLPLLERALRNIGFTRFRQTTSGQWLNLNRLKVMTLATVSPSDGPLGDCALVVDDGKTRIFNQNDARPLDLTPLLEDGRPVSAHFLQFSGAIWYPMVYDYPEQMMRTLGGKKRENEMARALYYIKQVKAAHVFPSSGPACFLDPSLFQYNDFDCDSTNTFPDQVVFLDYMKEHGYKNGHLIIPESCLMFEQGTVTIKHPYPELGIRESIFHHKKAYLEAYQRRQLSRIKANLAAHSCQQISIVAALKEWFEPLLAQADYLCYGIGGRIVLDCGDEAIVIDTLSRQVYAWNREIDWKYYFRIHRSLVEQCIATRQEDWVNALFLSFRFIAQRKGTYNEYIYTFFKCLSEERLRYAENYYQHKAEAISTFEQHGYRIQRICPHAGADLSRYGSFDLEQGILTCKMHGWQFDLKTGQCLTSEKHLISIGPSKDADSVEKTYTQRSPCSHCWFRQEESLKK
ncbi:Rieske 2Fe-2S domain-containing protein [Dictyobacter kobayashii]|uniref:Putative Rieske 2Fe-2S iron-sulfur protein n=1 Tax=Dictyobacter kobayashii TaxID=2014872 RepID=A0A402ASY8_9CHLR|nr:Rieske 2Fe-2S domain-containing protein [Dictyobacter kobayashii]GCE22240.1 putative Rieske 2Fe-2S iron-sulfur protein [Dictyobacter kobayashii]